MTRVVLLGLLLLLVAWAFWRVVDGVIEAFGGTSASRAPKRQRSPAVKLARDPICGTWVSPASARALEDGAGVHYFCSDECRARFRARS